MRQKASHPPTNDYRYCCVASEYYATVSVKYSGSLECLKTYAYMYIWMYTRREKQLQISLQLLISHYMSQIIASVFETRKLYDFITTLYLFNRSYIQHLSKDKIESIDNAPLPVFDLPEEIEHRQNYADYSPLAPRWNLLEFWHPPEVVREKFASLISYSSVSCLYRWYKTASSFI